MVSSPRKILVVDDNADVAQSLAALLNAMGHSAEYLTDPRAALSAAAEFNPDAAFLDIDMPHIDGFQLSMLLKQAFPGICVVAISAHDSDDLRRRGRESRFDAYIRKPVDTSILQTIFSPPPVR